MAKTVLIVEDNELNMKLFRDLLEAHGYQTSGTSNGFEALELVRSLRPDLILMDMRLPDMDGWMAAQTIKADEPTRDIPIIALTAHAMEGDRETALEAGCVDYETKPIEINRLLGKINQWLGNDGSTTPTPAN